MPRCYYTVILAPGCHRPNVGPCWFLHCGCTEYALAVHWNRRVSLVESEKTERRDARRVVRKG
jgi:hypothetical protein